MLEWVFSWCVCFSRSSPNPLACVLHDFLLVLLVCSSRSSPNALKVGSLQSSPSVLCVFSVVLKWCVFHDLLLVLFMNKKLCCWCDLVILLVLLITLLLLFGHFLQLFNHSLLELWILIVNPLELGIWSPIAPFELWLLVATLVFPTILFLWCCSKSNLHYYWFFFPNPLLFLVILVYFIEQHTSPHSPFFLISIIYLSVLHGCYNGPFLCIRALDYY